MCMREAFDVLFFNTRGHFLPLARFMEFLRAGLGKPCLVWFSEKRRLGLFRLGKVREC